VPASAMLASKKNLVSDFTAKPFELAIDVPCSVDI
jgi:hypothetical protein